MRVAADLSAYAVNINGKTFAASCFLGEFYEVVGHPSRVIGAGDPEPYGNRNNQVHFFDELGMYLLEHHARCTIESVKFVFDSREVPFVPSQTFHGQLSIAKQAFDPSMDIGQYIAVAPLPFKKHLGTWYYYDGEKISITLTTFSRKHTKSGLPSKIRGISSVNADFRDRGITKPPGEKSNGSHSNGR